MADLFDELEEDDIFYRGKWLEVDELAVADFLDKEKNEFGWPWMPRQADDEHPQLAVPVENPKEYIEDMQTLEATYWLFDEPNIPNLVHRAGDFLDGMYERYTVKPAEVEDASPKLFEARYEIVKHQKELTYKEAIIPINRNLGVVAFTDFLWGVPYGAVEMAVRVWELSSAIYPALSDPGAPVPPIPEDFFDERYTAIDTLYNYLFLDADDVSGFEDGLADEQQTDLLWWIRHNLALPDENVNPMKFPTPGEFMALGVRLFPTKPWGDQETSPYLFSGNWFDTLYYTSAIVEEVLEPTELIPFKRYKVKWRGKEEERYLTDYNKFIARPSGFEEYRVGDRVAVLKDTDPKDINGNERVSQTWKDDQEFKETIWRIAPITFYEMVREE